MASVELLAKAVLARKALGTIAGTRPSMEVKGDYVNLYWPPDKLPATQKRFESMMEAEPGEMRVQLGPVLTPYFTKKYTVYGLMALGAAFVLGKMS